jgi:hypothetical protein
LACYGRALVASVRQRINSVTLLLILSDVFLILIIQPHGWGNGSSGRLHCGVPKELRSGSLSGSARRSCKLQAASAASAARRVSHACLVFPVCGSSTHSWARCPPASDVPHVEGQSRLAPNAFLVRWNHAPKIAGSTQMRIRMWMRTRMRMQRGTLHLRNP